MHAEALSQDERRAFPRMVPEAIAAAPELDRFLSLDDVKRITTLGKTAIYARIGRGQFPRPIPLSRSKVAWSARDLAQWQQDQRSAPRADDDVLMLTAGEDIAA
jgi:prophage regulatory protein